MIYVIANTDKSDELQPKIFKFLKNLLISNGAKYEIIFAPKHIIESTINHINPISDFVLWNPTVAHNNLELVKKFNQSIVLLLNKTLLIQKVSLNNPINEQMAINSGFNLMYIDENFNDITNAEWKLVIQEDAFKISQSKFLDLIKK